MGTSWHPAFYAARHHSRMPPHRRLQTYHEELRRTARDLYKSRQWDLVVIVSQMACEVVAGASIADWLAARGVRAPLRQAIEELLNNSNLGNVRVRKIYTGLSNDLIQREPWWGDYRAHVTLRNNIIHKGHRADAANAEASIAVADTLIEHLLAHLP